jgi:glutathione peroxidase-family protein
MATIDYNSLNEKDWKNIYGKLSKKTLLNILHQMSNDFKEMALERDALKEINEHYEANYKRERDAWDKQRSDLQDEADTYKHLAKEAQSELRRNKSSVCQ